MNLFGSLNSHCLQMRTILNPSERINAGITATANRLHIRSRLGPRRNVSYWPLISEGWDGRVLNSCIRLYIGRDPTP